MPTRVGNYELGRTLGRGNFSKVKFATDTRDGSTWALKVVDRQFIQKEGLEQQLHREIAIMKMLQHPHIVNIREVLQTRVHVYLVLELVTGGEIFDKIVAAKRFDEATTRRYFQQLVAALAYCHSRGVAHRDLKPENLLLDSQNKLKLTDFGLSAFVSESGDRTKLLQTTCGTPSYVAPEVLTEQGYNGKKADVWSCGVILYVMLAGFLPFEDKNPNGLFLKIERAEYKIPRHVNPECAAMIKMLLVADPMKRPGLNDIISTPWFQADLPDEIKEALSGLIVSDVEGTAEGADKEPASGADVTPIKPTVLSDVDGKEADGALGTDWSSSPSMKSGAATVRQSGLVDQGLDAPPPEVSEEDMANAIIDIDALESSASGGPEQVQSTYNNNKPSNVFGIASKLILRSLAPLLTRHKTPARGSIAAGADLLVRKSTRLIANGSVPNVLSSFLVAFASFKAQCTHDEIQPNSQQPAEIRATVTVKGTFMSVNVLVSPTVSPKLVVVTFFRGRGPEADFQSFFRQVRRFPILCLLLWLRRAVLILSEYNHFFTLQLLMKVPHILDQEQIKQIAGMAAPLPPGSVAQRNRSSTILDKPARSKATDNMV